MAPADPGNHELGEEERGQREGHIRTEPWDPTSAWDAGGNGAEEELGAAGSGAPQPPLEALPP